MAKRKGAARVAPTVAWAQGTRWDGTACWKGTAEGGYEATVWKMKGRFVSHAVSVTCRGSALAKVQYLASLPAAQQAAEGCISTHAVS